MNTRNLIRVLFSAPVQERVPSIGLLVLRIALALMMLTLHGLPKLMHFTEELTKIEDPFGMGPLPVLVITILQEVGLSSLILLGLATRLACLPMAFTMIIAGFVVHPDWSWDKSQFIILYLMTFLTLAFTGPGWFSLDALITRTESKGKHGS